MGVARGGMGEPDLPAWERHADLAVVHVPGQDEVEGALCDAVERGREVCEQDRELGLLAQVGLSAARRGIEAREPDTNAPHVEHPALVEQERRRVERLQLDRLRERVAPRPDVVVAEDRVAARQLFQQASQLGLSARPRYEVARDADEVRVALAGPFDRLPHRRPAA